MIERFWSQVDRSGGPDACWPWTKGRNSGGYGYGKVFGQPERAHAVAYELSNGPIPPGLIVRHRCDNPPCCNPAHLEVGTHRDNAWDKIKRGRSGAPKADNHYNTTLTADDVRRIRELVTAGQTQMAMAAIYGIHNATVSDIVLRKTWSSVA